MSQPDFDPVQLADLASVLPVETVRDLAASFREMVTGLMEALEAAGGDVKSRREQAHDLKSTSGSFGALRLCELAEAVEHASTEGEAIALAPILAEMHATATAAFAALDEALAKLG